MRGVKAGALYFAAVFGVGFVLGVIRTLWVAPHVGARTAELLEIPLMLFVTAFFAWWVARRLNVPTDASERAVMGGVALLFLLSAESALTAWLRGISWVEYVADKDPVAALAYGASLALFAVMPLFVHRRVASPDAPRPTQDRCPQNG